VLFQRRNLQLGLRCAQQWARDNNDAGTSGVCAAGGAPRGVAMSEEANMIIARMRIEEIKTFYVHCGIYVAVNLVLIAINVINQDEVWWSLWALLGWGIGLLIHGLSVYGPVSILMMKWEQRKIAQLLHKD
jgi:hypothetical protein